MSVNVITKTEIINKVTSEELLPKKELLKFKVYLNNNYNDANKIRNIELALRKFKGEDKKNYLAEFLTIRNVNEQKEFLKKNTGIKAYFNNILENKPENTLKIAKSISTTKIVALMAAGGTPGLVIAGAVLARITVPIAIKYITSTFSNNNDALRHISKRLESINEEYKSDPNQKKKHLERIFKLIPESIYYNHSMPINKKMEFFETSLYMYKSCDKYVKNLMEKQSPQVLFTFLNIVREEVEKRGVDIKDISKKSYLTSNKGFASIQCNIFLKMFEDPNIMMSIIKKSKEAEKAIGDLYIEDAVGIVSKIGEKAKLFNHIDLGKNGDKIKEFIKIENIVDPKSLYKDVVSSNIESRLAENIIAKDFIKDTNTIIHNSNTFINEIIDYISLNDKMNEMLKKSVGKPSEAITKQINEIPKKIAEKLGDFSSEINEKLEALDEKIKDGKVNGKYGSNYIYMGVDTVRDFTKKIIKMTIDLIDCRLPVKDFINDTKKEFLAIWNFYDKVKDSLRWGLVEGIGLISLTSPGFNKNFQGHDVLNHKKDIPATIKSQLVSIRKKANKMNMVGPNDDIEKSMKKGLS